MDSDIYNKFLGCVLFTKQHIEYKEQYRELTEERNLAHERCFRELRAIKIRNTVKRNAWHARDFSKGIILKAETKAKALYALNAFELKRAGHEKWTSDEDIYWGYFHQPRMYALIDLGLIRSNLTCECSLKITKKDIV